MNINKNLAVSENGFAFDPTCGDSYSLNPIGAFIVNLLKQNKSEVEIINQLKEKYEVSASTLENDFFDFISMLKQYNLIEENE